MCGIVGYIGKKDLKKIVLDGLQELEYRGYDSAGFAFQANGSMEAFKAVGKLANLRQKTDTIDIADGAVIGHTRWATHGKPTEMNAHPHCATFTHIVHNGIIENYAEIKQELEEEGIRFLSQTDTEVIVHLFELLYARYNDIMEAFKAVIARLEGAYAILLMTKLEPEKIYFAKLGSPMVIGVGEGENFFASSDAPLIGHTTKAIYLEDHEYGCVDRNMVTIYNAQGQIVQPHITTLPESKASAQKEGFRFFMEKEIYEQSDVINDTLMGRVSEKSIKLEELTTFDFSGIEHVKLCACGTSYHAAMASAYLFERLAKVPTTVEIASEFRYKTPLLSPKTLFVVISQSGETADTLEALKMAKRAGQKSIAVCNVDNSSIVREADATILTRAGIEKGVASTKAFATQMMVLWLLVLEMGKRAGVLSDACIADEISAMRHAHVPLKVEEKLHERIRRLSKRYLHGHGFFFIGRDIFYPLALEGALKLKEISYLHAEGYPAGEMKHGPIALADAELFTIALLPKTVLYEKTKSNIEELSARDSTICAVTSEDFELADDLIALKTYEHPMHEFFATMIALQLLALEVSVRLGNDVDMPRNLAKSVTVE